jgi:NAD(P)H dehydrogenase (quinone)
MILITGAGGKTGRAVTAALAAKGEAVRALVRRETSADTVRRAGAREVVIGQMDHLDALTPAMRGIRAIYHICLNVSPHEFAYGEAVVRAARQAGVQRLVYHSVLRPHIAAMPHHWEKARVEEMLFASGLALTVLQPAAYMQNILAAWPAIVGEGMFRVPYPVATRLSLVDLEDVAQAAAIVLTQPGHDGALCELVGTAGLSQTEVATVLGRALDRPVRAVAETVEDWCARASGLTDGARETLIRMFDYYAAHGLAEIRTCWAGCSVARLRRWRSSLRGTVNR